jgi:protein disulfide-isomerase
LNKPRPHWSNTDVKQTLFAILAAVWLAHRGAAAPVWLTDLPQAQAQARAEHKLVLMDFTGSDWCPGCMEFAKAVLDSAPFQAYASTNLVVVIVDFPDKKPQSAELKQANQALLGKYSVDGYPTQVVLAADGKELGRQSGFLPGTSPADFIAWVDQLKGKAENSAASQTGK